MTDSPARGLSTSRDPGAGARIRPPLPSTPEQPANLLSALNSMRRKASASRTFGRFAVDPSGRAGELPNTPAEVAKDPIVKDPNGDRRSGDERRSHPPGGKQAGESRTSELPPSEAPRADASATGDHRMQSPVRRDK